MCSSDLSNLQAQLVNVNSTENQILRSRPMPLNHWIKEASSLLSQNSAAINRRTRRQRRRPTYQFTSRQYRSGDQQVRSNSETLERRVLPASLVWIGDINPHFHTEAFGNTNWDTNSLPASGDNLTFAETSGEQSLFNDSDRKSTRLNSSH